MEESGKINLDRLKAYSGDIGKIAITIEALVKSDGWQIFLALFEKEKNDIKDKEDYSSIELFKADRKAIEIVTNILERFKEYILDATEADKLLKTLSDKEPNPENKTVLILDSLEEHGREQG